MLEFFVEVKCLYTIAICDDETVFRSALVKICCDICEKLRIEYSVCGFEAGEEFLSAFTGGVRYDMLLLDILMDKTNGVELARKVRECDSNTAIIFITSNAEFALQGYEVNALHYLMKPPDETVLERLIASDYQRRFKSNFLVFKSGSQIIRIPIKDIICLETVGRRVEITLLEGMAEYPGKLSELIDHKEQLIRCHKAFAVNIAEIRELTRSDAVAMNGKLIPVSRTYLKDVQKALLKQIRDT